MSKLLVILGPTASGKSALAVSLAKQYNGEVISADSRQIYQGLDVGTGKLTPSEMDNIPHYLLDVVKPHDYFSVTDFKKYTEIILTNIIKKSKLPIIVGGTGQYIQAIVDNIIPPEVPPNTVLRESLKHKSVDELFKKLKSLDPCRAKTIEKENPRRLIRAIEIATALGSVPPLDILFPLDYLKSPYNILQIGLQLSDKELYTNIHQRVYKRLLSGFIEEVEHLRASGVSDERLYEIGLGYRIITEYLQGKHTRENLASLIATSEQKYAKRQKRWFKRDTRVNWFDPKDSEKIEMSVKHFLD